MESIQIKNLKSIDDSQVLKIKPITIFVGKNSSGKSSIIRSFPLFKQSIESKTLGTILWSGKYVDYGSFHDSINSNRSMPSDPGEISFAFKFKMQAIQNRGTALSDGTLVRLSVRVSGDEYAKTSYTIFSYEIFGNSIVIKYNSELKILMMKINETDFTKQAQEYYRSFKTYSIIPLMFTGARAAGGDTIRSSLIKELKNHMHGRTSDTRISNVARSLRFTDDDHLRRTLSSKTLVGEVAARKMGAWTSDTPAFQQIKDQIIFCNLDKMVDQVSDYTRAYFISSRYITPLRAAADRYYRIQNTSIEELDPNGSNLAMFLHAKRKEEIDEINIWLLDEIGFTIDIVSSHGHASIFVIDSKGVRSNIADTGFGFSQVLPILIQVWQLSKKRGARILNVITPTTIIIEQPELHLHPKMQSRVGDAFCKAVRMAKENHVDIRIIIETHSKDVIQSVGRCIEDGVILTEDVAIYLVDKNSEKNITESYFDEGGFLQQWPYGFFDGE